MDADGKQHLPGPIAPAVVSGVRPPASMLPVGPPAVKTKGGAGGLGVLGAAAQQRQVRLLLQVHTFGKSWLSAAAPIDCSVSLRQLHMARLATPTCQRNMHVSAGKGFTFQLDHLGWRETAIK